MSTGIKHRNNDPYKERLRTACVLSSGDRSGTGTWGHGLTHGAEGSVDHDGSHREKPFGAIINQPPLNPLTLL